ncbi:MAG: hypothetical protein JNK81_13425 [Anaerolineales bacterium]|nr:hypothetical protein [Anaerolineales bacterium]
MFNIFKKNRFIFLLFLIVSLACNLTNPISPENIPSSDTTNTQPTENVVIQGLCDNPIYPVKQNATWTYFNTGGPSGDFTYTDTITEVRPDGFTLTTTFEGLTRTQKWACETGGLKALEYGGGPTAAISTQDVNMQFSTLQVTGVSLPKEIVPGMQWLYSLTLEGGTTMPDGSQTKSSGTFNVTMQEMGSETITVPAGTFETIKFQATTTLDIVGEFQGIQVPMKITGSTITWFAPNIGQIKSISNSDFGGAPFTLTTELQSYNIP